MGQFSRSPLRICFPFVGDTLGGSHLSALALIDGLDPRRFDPQIVLHKDGLLAEHLLASGKCFMMAPMGSVVESEAYLPTAVGALRATRRLTAFAKELGVQLVHTNDVRMHTSWAVAARIAGARLILHQRSITRSRRVSVAARLADSVLTNSEFCRRSFLPAMRRRAQVVPNPVQPPSAPVCRQAARAEILSELDAGPETRLVAFVANVRAQKRPLVFVDAIAALRRRFGDDTRGVMFGELRTPGCQELLTHIERVGLDGLCVPMGPRFPIEPLLAGCDVLLAPAVGEGFGRTLVEAMLVGTPVVAVHSGAHPEVVDDQRTGLLVPPDNAQALADAATRLLDDVEFTESIVEAARDAATTRYDTERHVDIVQAVYDSAVAATSDPRTRWRRGA